MKKLFVPIIALLMPLSSFAITLFSKRSDDGRPLVLSKIDSGALSDSVLSHGSHHSHASHASHASHFSQTTTAHHGMMVFVRLNKEDSLAIRRILKKGIYVDDITSISIAKCYVRQINDTQINAWCYRLTFAAYRNKQILHGGDYNLYIATDNSISVHYTTNNTSSPSIIRRDNKETTGQWTQQILKILNKSNKR